MQWIVQDGVLEVDGAPMQDIDTMRRKYFGLNEVGQSFVTTDPETGAPALHELDGFRLLRRPRLAEAAVHSGEDTWCTVEVRRPRCDTPRGGHRHRW